MDQLLRELSQFNNGKWGGTLRHNPSERDYALEVLHDALKQAAETGLLDEIDKDMTSHGRGNSFVFVNAVHDRMSDKIHRDLKQPELQKVILKV